LTQVCIATANAAQQGFERSEARLAAIETELNRRLGELTREVHSVVAELKAGSDPIGRLPAPTRAWSLDGVTQLHHQLRTADGTATPEEPKAIASAAPAVAGLLPEAAGALTTRVESLERALTERDSTLKDTTERSSRSLRLALSAAAFVLVIGALIAVNLNGDVRKATQRAEQAEQAQAAATEDAKKRINEVSRSAAEQIAEASKRAAQAQLVSEVLAAPDLARFTLEGRRALTGLSALVSWSPTRGVVFSGSLMPAPPAGSIYQLWLVTRAGATSAGTFTPDPSGSATVSTPVPPAVRGVVGAAMVTLEAEGGRTAPVGPVVFARPVVAPPAETP
jgi:hypothetical protein